MVPGESRRRDGKPRWIKHRFNLFPIVLDSQGVPWAEANVYLLSRLENVLHPVMTTYAGVADDLGTYRAFLDEHEIDWMAFPVQKLARPTYRFNGHLKMIVAAGEIAPATAKRRMSTVVAFYRWLISEGVLTPGNAPWKESDRFVQYQNREGFKKSLTVTVTDLRVKTPRQDDPYDGQIEDGGRLRPLSRQEQEWLVDALIALGNTEMTLIHLFSLLTGARIQTTLTLRARHAWLEIDDEASGEIALPVGPGTGIDTKRDKRQVLHVPTWFYQMLKTYAASDRARERRGRAVGGDHPDQYLFLSQRGAPLYRSKADAQAFDEDNRLHHQKVGQGVRQFIAERVNPLVRERHATPGFSYQFHDTRATAGMNWTDRQLLLVSQGQATLHEAREFVRVRMGHDSSAVTDRYLRYRQNLKLVRHIATEHETHLRLLSARAMEGLE
jgi:hypothetical protein